MSASNTFEALAANASDHDAERRSMVLLTAAVAGVATVGVAIPLVASFSPSERALASGAAVEADISDLAPGAMKTVEWRGKPVWIVRRTEETLADLATLDERLVDPRSEVKSQQPAYAQNTSRSIKPEYLVAVGICTHLGCSPSAVAKGTANPGVGQDWKGGFFCPCHGSTFDSAGRVFKNKPAPTNLEIPPHKYLSDSRLLIGEDELA
ncbi:ubiquinol-cytochrome c reductase iron-sulfur subunit [Rhodoferax fermentans]|uniref:Ubiquinol-cytochrome c reductase iron-sulfur subunit n=2 Tax=Rhodoferax fermentans TaxID=28066 RepID=A0A1T1AVX7_RHOFE|nr:ubiquinol-cytochrome c reductase iron-sulfur subunit [Rhodoferax fermentans]MBK1685834.1 ubiquinol-cytochrome c reductase iron-sulfur subunit [Rhodoferax fermentans]OOV08240.1 ubiquinol-cytochrome c reductase iron-sulfur subunit [Rhodoferax fermentans]